MDLIREAQETNMNDGLSRRALVLVAMAFLAWGALPGLVHAAPVSFKVPLSGGQEVPPVFPAGAGIAALTYDPSTWVVTWSVAYSDLSSPATMAHFHGPAQPGKNAPVLVWLIKQGSPMESPINGQATLTPDQARQFAAGEWYINIHTQAHPEGEIRGQVLTPSGADDARSKRRSRSSKH
jgi:CHRD domain-containing protein